jgi:DNA-directed RNA polymerase subunit RPC12/RpoP
MGGNRLARLCQYVGITMPSPPARPYICLGCDTQFDVQYHVCPECEGFRVEVREEIRTQALG